MATVSISAPGLGSGGFLYNNGNNNARLCVTAETENFDMEIIKNWQDEGFDVLYIPYNGGGKEYGAKLQSVKDGLGVGENYGVVGMLQHMEIRNQINPIYSIRRCRELLSRLLPQTY
jgi:hypothetical protein